MRLTVLLAALLIAAPPAQAKWFRATGAHFTVYSEGSADDVRAFAEQLERYDALLRTAYHVAESASVRPVTVFELANQADVQRLANGERVGGFYVSRAASAVAYVPRDIGAGGPMSTNPQRVLFHEYMHHFMLQHFPAVYPAWFIEGVADFYSTTSFDKAGRATIGMPPLNRAGGLRNNVVMPVSRLLTEKPRGISPAVTASFYSHAWLLTHYLTFETGRAAQLTAYLTALNSGKSPSDAAAVFGDLKALDRALSAYAQQNTVKSIRYDNPTSVTVSVSIVPLSAGEEATIEERAAVRRGLRPADSGRIVAALQTAVKQFPDDLSVRVLLGDAQIQTGDIGGALGSADAVLAAQPDNPRALLIKGQAELGLAAKASPHNEAAVTAARRWIVKANRADTEDPLPLLAYYRSFLVQGMTPPAAAVAGLRKALELAPQANDIRLTYANALARSGDRKQAVTVLEPLAFNPHGGALADRAVQMIAALKSDTPAAATVSESGKNDDAH